MLNKFFPLLAICLLGFSSGRETQIYVTEPAVVYLTFDDGPQDGSENVNDVVLKERINVDVFLVGKQALLSESNIERYELYLNNRYVERCNHTYRHADKFYRLFYNNTINVYDDFAFNGILLELSNGICRLPGCNVWRLPGRSFGRDKLCRAAADLLAANGARVFGWDVEWDYDVHLATPVRTPDEMAAVVDSLVRYQKTFTPGHIVILCHDQMFRYYPQKLQLFEFIGKLKASRKYRFGHLSKYPDASGYNVREEISE